LIFASLSSLAERLVEQLGYPGLVLVMAVEHIFPPIPSEIVLPLAGFEVGRGNLDLWLAIASATLGSLLGASVLYLIARQGGRPLVLRLNSVLRVDEAGLDRAEERFHRHSAWIVVLGRMVPGLRSLVSLPPGLLRMPYWRYLLLTGIGSVVWNTILIVAGQQLGSRWDEIGGIVDPIAKVVIIACIPVTVGWLLLRRRRHRIERANLSGVD
jgi:membrane protein DedA with SNARE-associated domain